MTESKWQTLGLCCGVFIVAGLIVLVTATWTTDSMRREAVAELELRHQPVPEVAAGAEPASAAMESQTLLSVPSIWDEFIGLEADSPDEEAREYLTHYSELLSLARQAGADNDVAWFMDLLGIEPNPCAYFDTKSLTAARNMARLLGADLPLARKNGQPGRAVDDVLACLTMGSALARRPYIVAQLTRDEVVGIALGQLLDAFGPGELAPADSVRIVGRLNEMKAEHHGFFADAVRGEARMDLLQFEMLKTCEWPECWGDANEPLEPNLLERVYGSRLARPLLNLDERAYARIMSQFADAAEKPYFEAAPELERIKEDAESGSFHHFVTNWLTSVGLDERAFIAESMQNARIDLVRMGLTLEQYQAREGTYPGSLEAIAAGLGGAVPVDPFTGKPYRYVTDGETFSLYSAGEDLEDDSGVHGSMGGDIVWRGR